jgi:phospholipid/cholesterol/gamma-HCH transport system permease protein
VTIPPPLLGSLLLLRHVLLTMPALFAAPPIVDTVLVTARLVVRSLPIAFIVCFFSGAMLEVQAAASLLPFGAMSMAGLVVGFGGVREVFPLLAGGTLAARSGAELASQLGSMKVTRQVEALAMMGLDPHRELVAPRVWACVLGGPVIVWASMVSGILGAHLVGIFQLGIDRGASWSTLLSTVGAGDLFVGGVKGVALGFIIGVISTHEGLMADAGAASVGRAANRAVILGMIVVCSASLALSVLLYGTGGQ